MEAIKLANSPITYFLSRAEHSEWVLFLHAAFVDHRMFRAQFSCFQSKYNVLAVDIIGHGKSTDTKKGDTIERMSEWIFDILKAEKIGKIHLVGISLGAVLAQDFANRYPHSVQSLACFGGYNINHFDENAQRENSRQQIAMMLKAMLSVKWFAKENKKISAYTPQAQEEFYAMNVRFPKRSFRFLASLGRMVNQFPAGQRSYPLLIGCGQFDIPMEQTAIQAWKDEEPGCQVMIFENAGHCVNLDVPQEFNQVMEKFWISAKQQD